MTPASVLRSKRTEGAATHYLGYVVDISELRDAEDALRELEARMQQSQKLESLGLLAGGIAHDFNNVLTAVLGNAHLALMNLAPDAEIVPFLSDIRKSAEHAADIVKQMMTYAGQSEAEFRSLDLDQLIGDIRHLMHAAIPKKIRLDVLPPRQGAAGGGLPPIAGDATQIRQVIMNLVLNGSEASQDGEGQVVVRAEAIDADSFAEISLTYGDLPAGRYVVLEVCKAHRDDVVAVLLDVTMPKLDGVETFHELRRLYPTLPILMSSGYQARRAAVESIVTGDAVDFLPKPFRPTTLLEKIHGLLRSADPI